MSFTYGEQVKFNWSKSLPRRYRTIELKNHGGKVGTVTGLPGPIFHDHYGVRFGNRIFFIPERYLATV